MPLLSSSTTISNSSRLSLHDALPIYATEGGDLLALLLGELALARRLERAARDVVMDRGQLATQLGGRAARVPLRRAGSAAAQLRSEEHTSELQSQSNLVCRLLLEKKK